MRMQAAVSDEDATASPKGLLTGLERLRTGLGSRGLEVPFEQVFPMTRVRLAEGVYDCTLHPFDLIHGFNDSGLLGHLVTLADHALGNAVLSTLGAGEYGMTQSLRIDVDPSGIGPGPVTCRGRHLSSSNGTALAEGSFVGSKGFLGRAVLRSFVLRARASDTQRTADWAVARPIKLDSSPAVDVGLDLPWFATYPVDSSEVVDGRARFTCRPGPTLTNSLGSIHGGAAAILIDLAGALALQKSLEGERTMPLALTIEYHRPGTPDQVQASADVTRIGRSIVTVEHTLRDAEGRVSVVATSTRLRRSPQPPNPPHSSRPLNNSPEEGPQK